MVNTFAIPAPAGMFFSTMEISVTDWVGYLASALVLVSFLMKNLKNLRLVNTLGCSAFVVYGFLLGSVPVIVTNLAIIGINFYYLFFKKQF